jgi:leucyl/phenylalanyl-tRNA--protein transferase
MIVFPDPTDADDDGLLAMGGNLQVETMLTAYRSGIFPWSVDPITWWSPDPRGIIDWDDFHVSRRVARKMRSGSFHFTVNKNFSEVIHACAEPGPSRGGVWLDPKLIAAYIRLHQHGHAHSVECWRDDELVGGVYGVAIGGLFAGESMFSRVSDASKMALAFLLDHLQSRGFVLFDTQMVTEHTLSLGAKEIRRSEYLQRLRVAIDLPCHFVDM